MQTDTDSHLPAGVIGLFALLFLYCEAFAQAPHIVTQPMTHTVCEGATVNLQVEATGALPLTYNACDRQGRETSSVP